MPVYNNSNKKTRRDDWATPTYFFDLLDKEFNFTLDPCASHRNHKCKFYFTEEDNGLAKSWEGYTVFVNPPYCDKKEWLEKIYKEMEHAHWSSKPITIVLLFPDSTDLPIIHKYVFNNIYTDEVRFTEGRIAFIDPVKGRNSNQTGSMVVVYRYPGKHNRILLGTIKHKYLRDKK